MMQHGKSIAFHTKPGRLLLYNVGTLIKKRRRSLRLRKMPLSSFYLFLANQMNNELWLSERIRAFSVENAFIYFHEGYTLRTTFHLLSLCRNWIHAKVFPTL